MNRKQKSLLYSIVAIVGATLIFSVIVGYISANKLVWYESTDGYKIKYPEKWGVIDKTSVEQGLGGVSALFQSPAEDAADSFFENVNVVVQDLSNNPMSLDDYSFKAVDQVKAVFQEGIVVVEDESTKVGGMQGHKFVFVAKHPQYEPQMMMVWTIKDNIAYQINFTALSTTYKDYIGKAKKMIRSFEVTR